MLLLDAFTLITLLLTFCKMVLSKTTMLKTVLGIILGALCIVYHPNCNNPKMNCYYFCLACGGIKAHSRCTVT